MPMSHPSLIKGQLSIQSVPSARSHLRHAYKSGYFVLKRVFHGPRWCSNNPENIDKCFGMQSMILLSVDSLMLVHVILSSKIDRSMLENDSASESRAFMMQHRFSIGRV